MHNQCRDDSVMKLLNLFCSIPDEGTNRRGCQKLALSSTSRRRTPNAENWETTPPRFPTKQNDIQFYPPVIGEKLSFISLLMAKSPRRYKLRNDGRWVGARLSPNSFVEAVLGKFAEDRRDCLVGLFEEYTCPPPLHSLVGRTAFNIHGKRW